MRSLRALSAVCSLCLFVSACEEDPPDDPPAEDLPQLYVVQLEQNQIDLEMMWDAGFEPSGQLPGNNPQAPGAALLFLDQIEVNNFWLEFGITPIPFFDLPWDPVPLDHDLAACDHPTPPGRYCAYQDGALTADRCDNETIESRLQAYDALPPLAGDDYVNLVNLGPTVEGRPIYALRIGQNATTGGVPQVVIVAAQHSREWITTDAAMRLIDDYVTGYSTDPAVQAALQDVVITIVPVANPDGYEFTFPGGDRDWRKNRQPGCAVDTNRNFPFSGGQMPGASWLCSALSFHGASPELPAGHPFNGASEPETDATVALLEDPAFPTAVAVNVHAYGQLVMYTDGVSEGFAPCGSHGNCSNPDLAVQRVLGGDFREPKFTDPHDGYPYRRGQLYRNIYAVTGGLNIHAQQASGVTTFALELGRGTCRFLAETRSESLNQGPSDQLRAVADELIDRGVGLVDGSFYDSHPDLGAFALPHLHRRHAETHFDYPPGHPAPEFLPDDPPGEHPALRVAARNFISEIDVFPENGDPALPLADDVMDGVAYRSWQWRPSEDPFVFPRRLEICAEEANCEFMALPGGGTSVDICRSDYFSATDGWEHVGRAADPFTVQDQCYWRTTGGGSGVLPSGEVDVWTLGHTVDLSGIGQSHLVFSYERNSGAGMDLTIKTSTTGNFDPCDASTGCRVAYASRLPYGFNVTEQGGLRTEIVDIADHDGGVVHLRWELRDSSPFVDEFKIYDPIMLGWATGP